MKEKTFCKTIRFTRKMIDDWNYLKSINVRPADIFRQIMEAELDKKARELGMESKIEKLPS